MSDSEAKSNSLPGPKKKQAQALSQNVKWMCETFGTERVGFLTLTVGDEAPGGFVKVSKRAEASRRFNSLLTHVIRSRYQCGVIVTERHKDGGIHFHLVVATGRDIRGAIDFAAVFPKRVGGRYVTEPDYSTANDALKLEWKFWRERAQDYGFGRCQMQPVRESGEALGYYVGKYISKSWEARCDDDKGGRLVRYFGRWSKDGHKFKPPWYANHGSLTPWARAWRECAKQVQIKMRLEGFNVDERNVKLHAGSRWAWRWTQNFNASEFFVRGDEKLREALSDHNQESRERWPLAVRGIWERGADWWIVEPGRETEWRRARMANRRALREAREAREKIAALRESLTVGHPVSNPSDNQT